MIGNNKRDLEMDGKKKKPLLLLLLFFFSKDNTSLKSRSQSIKGGSLMWWKIFQPYISIQTTDLIVS